MTESDEPELTPDDVEEMLVRFGERQPVDVDENRVHETLIHAVGFHPSRDWIIEQLRGGARLWLALPEPPRDVFQLRLGEPGYEPAMPIRADDPELHERSVALGDVELMHVLRRPQG